MKKRQDFLGFGKDSYDPSIRDDVAEFMFDVCSKKQFKRALEIGTYIGFSASVILSASKTCELTTIEIDEENANYAKENLKEFENRVNIIRGDALAEIRKLSGEFDLIFIDGPKAQYPKFFEMLFPKLKSGGVLIADNIYFHGYVEKDGFVAHKNRTIVNRLREFENTVLTHPDLTSKILSIGDGVSYSEKR